MMGREHTEIITTVHAYMDVVENTQPRDTRP